MWWQLKNFLHSSKCYISIWSFKTNGFIHSCWMYYWYVWVRQCVTLSARVYLWEIKFHFGVLSNFGNLFDIIYNGLIFRRCKWMKYANRPVKDLLSEWMCLSVCSFPIIIKKKNWREYGISGFIFLFVIYVCNYIFIQKSKQRWYLFWK